MQFSKEWILSEYADNATINEEKLVSVQVCGGGYGHGVGLSQNGVKGMVDAGYNYKQILNHYFPNTVLQNL